MSGNIELLLINFLLYFKVSNYTSLLLADHFMLIFPYATPERAPQHEFPAPLFSQKFLKVPQHRNAFLYFREV